MLLQGHQAARVRRQAAELLCRFLGGDLAIVDEVCAIRGFQEQLAADRPDDPRRIFGEAVEAAASGSSGTVGEQLARVCTDIVAHALPAVIDKLTAHIDERLAHLESRQRVNLNVRAPKRSSPHDPRSPGTSRAQGGRYPSRASSTKRSGKILLGVKRGGALRPLSASLHRCSRRGSLKI